MTQHSNDKKGTGVRGRVRVVIVGGGCAGLAAAWQLARQPGYEIHIYEKSWRLGGKGGSVRDEKGRILEHGLHVWLGFYENAFRMMRECYAEVEAQGWGPGPNATQKLAHGSLWDAFIPEPNIGVGGLQPDGAWTLWNGYLPPEKGLPGDDLDVETNPFTLASYLLRAVNLLKALVQSVIAPPGAEVPGEPRPDTRSDLDEVLDLDFSFDALRSPAVLVERVTALLRVGVLTTAAGVLQVVTILERMVQQLNYAPQVPDSILQLIQAVLGQARKQLRDFVSIDPKLRWKTEIIDIVMTIMIGLFRDRVLFAKNGLDSINHIDYRAWLLQHGATKTSVASPFIEGIYDLVFAYRKGNRDRPALAAGVALRGALRMFFTYRGSMFWRMRSGMGDAVFAPLYKVLLLGQHKTWAGAGSSETASTVAFHFRHELAQIDFNFEDKANRYVSGLVFRTMGRPADLDRCSSDALDACGCWPEDPNSRFPSPATRGKVSLQAGAGARGFDAVVFALGVDDFVNACVGSPDRPPAYAPLFSALPQWNRMRQKVETVATKSAQVWLRSDLEELGWYRGSGIVTALQLRFDTWADMSHTLTAEKTWRHQAGVTLEPADEARSVAYFCGVLPDVDAKRSGPDVHKAVTGELADLLSKHIQVLWPSAFTAGRTPTDLVIGRPYVQVNVEGSDRYTLSLPNTIHYRMSPLDRSIINMTVAGDWTSCGLDAGCVEAAVMSGMLAAHAISQKPDLRSIIGYDHP